MDRTSVLLQSRNEGKVKSLELTASEPELTLGRSSACDVPIADAKCSSKHCKVSLVLTRDAPELTVEDLSSNGTFVNGKRVMPSQIGKNLTAVLQNGDTLTILKGDRVPAGEIVEFEVVMKPGKHKGEELAAPPTKKPKLNSDLSEDLQCGICVSVIHQCVTLMPCLHNVTIT